MLQGSWSQSLSIPVGDDKPDSGRATGPRAPISWEIDLPERYESLPPDDTAIREHLNVPGCQIGIRVDREVRSANGELLSRESWYFITSLEPDSITPRQLRDYIRGHWQVENCLHFVKDRWWDEDRHYTKRPGLAEAFASLTNAALAVHRLIHPPGEPLRATAERIQWHPSSALPRLGFNPL